MRKTKKYRQAISCITRHDLPVRIKDHESTYEALEAINWFWDAKLGVWEKKQFKPSNSVFEADNGDPTGIVKIRVMAHPDDLEPAIQALKQCAGFRVIEISEKTYPNRKGSGERIYTTVILDGAS